MRERWAASPASGWGWERGSPGPQRGWGLGDQAGVGAGGLWAHELMGSAHGPFLCGYSGAIIFLCGPIIRLYGLMLHMLQVFCARFATPLCWTTYFSDPANSIDRAA